MFKDKILLITGGTGSFGSTILEKFQDIDIKEIRIFSRDETKQHDLRVKLNNPKGAFYVFPDISFFFGKKIGNKMINNSTDFAFFLLEDAHVATVSGEAFGNKDCIRISYAASKKEIIEAVKRIKSAVK